MRILSVSAQKPHSTGSGVYLTELVRGFATMGHTQAVVAGVYESDPVAFPTGVAWFPVYFGSPELPFPIAGMSDEMPYESTRYRDMTEEMVQAFRAAFTRVLRQAVEEFQPDVILCHHLYLVTALTRELFPALPVWAVCHGTDLRQMKTNPLERAAIRAAIARLDRIFCLHEEQLAQVLQCYPVGLEHLRVVGCGFHEGIFRDLASPKQAPGIRLVYAGKISEKKGVWSLLRALDHLGWRREDFTLRLCGGFPGEAQREEVEALACAGGWDVTFLGRLTQEELAQEFNRGDVFVLPSFYEGLPLVLAESMACGMRAVCTDLPGVRPWMDENIPNHGAYFVPLPPMLDVDTPDPQGLPGFERDLATAIRAAAKAPRRTPDLSRLSWRAVCGRILGA